MQLISYEKEKREKRESPDAGVSLPGLGPGLGGTSVRELYAF